MQAINTIRIELDHPPINDYFCNSLGSFFEFEQTAETFGITTLPADVVHSFGNRPTNSVNIRIVQSLYSLNNILRVSICPVVHLSIVAYSSGEFMYTFLAESQKTEIAVAAVYTREETQLYLLFLTEDELYRKIKFTEEYSKPNFSLFAKVR